MKIQEIYQRFDKIGAITFATVEHDRPRTRIAHLFAFDDEGLYFRIMTTKPFYAQMKTTGKVAIGGMYPNSAVVHNEKGMPKWEPGLAVNLTGDEKEAPCNLLKKRAAVESLFELGVKDIERYPAITIFYIYRGLGDFFKF